MKHKNGSPEKMNFRDAVSQLLEATENLANALALEASLPANEEDAVVEGPRLSEAFETRELAFVAVQAASRTLTTRDSVTRAMLDRVAELDAQIIDRGVAEFDALRGARQSLQRQRSAVAAHHSRERDEPRFVAVKA